MDIDSNTILDMSNYTLPDLVVVGIAGCTSQTSCPSTLNLEYAFYPFINLYSGQSSINFLDSGQQMYFVAYFNTQLQKTVVIDASRFSGTNYTAFIYLNDPTTTQNPTILGILNLNDLYNETSLELELLASVGQLYVVVVNSDLMFTETNYLPLRNIP